MKNQFKLFFALIISVFCSNSLFGQSDIAIPGFLGHTGIPGWYCGWNVATPMPLDIVHGNPLAINFFTNAGGGPVWVNQRMTITGFSSLPLPLGANVNSNLNLPSVSNVGYVGISSNFGAGAGFFNDPQFRLDVDDDININNNPINPASSGYRINGKPVLQCPQAGFNTNLFVGQDVGNVTNILALDVDNVFVGRRIALNANPLPGGIGLNNVYMGDIVAMNSNRSAEENVIIGFRCGAVFTDGAQNVFVGGEAGTSNTSSDFNVFVGSHAGYSCVGSGSNVFVGGNAGYMDLQAFNTFVGFDAGFNNVNGRNSVCVGANAGLSNLVG